MTEYAWITVDWCTRETFPKRTEEEWSAEPGTVDHGVTEELKRHIRTALENMVERGMVERHPRRADTYRATEGNPSVFGPGGLKHTLDGSLREEAAKIRSVPTEEE